MRTLLVMIMLLITLAVPSAAEDEMWIDEDLKEVNLEYRNPLIRDIKILLKGRGFEPGAINGEDNEEFRKAIKEFEKTAGFEETGEPSFNNYKRLLEADGLGVLQVTDFRTMDGCAVSFRYSTESGVLVIQEKCKTDSGVSPVEDDGVVEVPGMQNTYIPEPFFKK
ncbi:MAG: peptidoglycan-binding protein [Candidatus Omnitrophica bacterium]|nr:peptidoglycan-binding protein [Candidatus Omnitrophota bacterium]MCB9720348.1 peptidoglycan-binding protein [Candidatus Omnitrophota bacterium]